MRILRVAQKVYPDVAGGGPYHVHALSRDQAAMGHDVTVLTVDHDGNGPRTEERDDYTLVRYPALAEPLGNAIAPGVARHLRRVPEFDVVHAHSHLYFSTNLAALARSRYETPLAITNHGLFSQTAPAWIFDAYLRTLGRWTFDRADVVFCYTDTDSQRLRVRGVDARIAVVQNGIDTERFTPDGPRSSLVEGGKPVALFVGRFVEGKRPGAVVEAVARVREIGADLQLYFCGRGPLRDDLEAKATALDIAEAVHFLGQVPYDEMPAVYRSADVMVLPSRAEGVPRTVLEAISSGVPVVCSQLDQLRGIVGVDDRGALVDVDADDALAEALHRWVKQEVTPTPLGEAFAWQTTVTETTEELQTIAHCR